MRSRITPRGHFVLALISVFVGVALFRAFAFVPTWVYVPGWQIVAFVLAVSGTVRAINALRPGSIGRLAATTGLADVVGLPVKLYHFTIDLTLPGVVDRQ
jgi:hypothetical protein